MIAVLIIRKEKKNVDFSPFCTRPRNFVREYVIRSDVALRHPYIINIADKPTSHQVRVPVRIEYRYDQGQSRLCYL